MTASERRSTLGALGLLAFAWGCVSVVVVPVLTQIAGELHITTGNAGLIVAAYGVPGIVIAILAGPNSDRFGRKLFLVGGSLIMGGGTVLSAVAPTFELLILSRALAGVGACLLYPNTQSIIADTFPHGERSRAISIVIAMNTMANVVALPVAGVVAEATSWRVSFALAGILALVASATLFRLISYRRPAANRRAGDLYRQITSSRSAVAVLVAGVMATLSSSTWATYFIVFFQFRYNLSVGVASTVGLTLGVGVILGSVLGGRLGDRGGHKRVLAACLVTSGALLVLQTNAPLPLAAAATLNLVLSALIGARFTTNIALLGEQVPDARGTMFAISSSAVSVGMAAGAAIGGILVDASGFGALGVFCGLAALSASAIVVAFVTEKRMEVATI